MFGAIRTTTNEQGEPLFVGKDVAEALGYKNSRKALLDHVDEEDKGTVTIRDAAYETRATVITESGLYSLVLSSKLPQARVFKHWVTSVVLPAIRKTGGYIPTKDAKGRKLTDLEVVCLAFKIQERTIEEQHKLIKEMAPKAEYVDEVLDSVSCYTTTQIAKEMGMTVYDLTRELIGRKVMYKQSGQYMLYAEYARKGYARSRTHLHRDSEGNVYTEMYLVWTEEGREFIHRLIETSPETQSQEELIQLELAFSA
jgi:prophage antirepressor-like protein